MPLARWRPLAKAANFAPSGWYAATPIPAANTATRTKTYVGATAAAPTPTAESATPPGRSHIAPRWSDHSPKSGWTSDDDTSAASITPAVAV